MRKLVNNAVVFATISAMLIVASQVGAIAADARSRIEGRIVGIDGTPGIGYTIHLIAEDGEVVSRATTDAEGLYTFAALAAGTYSLGVETPEGVVAPVAAPPVRVAAGELARRDIKLVQADSAAMQRITTANPAVGSWWAGLSTGAKVGVIIGLAAVTYGIIEAFDDDDDDVPASGFVTAN